MDFFKNSNKTIRIGKQTFQVSQVIHRRYFIEKSLLETLKTFENTVENWQPYRLNGHIRNIPDYAIFPSRRKHFNYFATF